MSTASAPRQKSNWIRIAILATLALLAPSVAFADRAPVRDPDRLIRKFPWSYKELAERQIVMQQQDYSCGAAALATIVRYYWGDDVGEAKFLDLLPGLLTPEQMEDRLKNGLTLTDLRNVCNKAGYQATMAKVKFEELAQGKVPVVVGIKAGKVHEHFVVFRGTDWAWAYLADPIRGNIRLPVGEFINQWQKNAILIVAKPDTPVKAVNPLAVRCTEVNRGWLNWQMIRSRLLATPVPNPLPGY
jgi:predicted double-glycine peptidase